MNTNEMDTVKKLEKLDFSGIDADLETSLFEYGMAWKVGERETEFIYGVGVDEVDGEAIYTTFDRCSFGNDLDVLNEFDYADFEAIFSFTGSTQAEFDALPLTQKIFDLVSYYGFENVFGSTYWEGFKIEA